MEEDRLRIIHLPSDRLKEAIRIMDEMDRSAPDPDSIGGRLKAGKKWREFQYYKNAKYTLQKRGEDSKF